MASKTALPIARLRALGCRVSTVIGHDPAIGDWVYSLRLPDSIGKLEATRAGDDISTEDPMGPVFGAVRGVAEATVPRYSDGHHVIVRTALYVIGKPAPRRTERAEAERDVAALLSALADVLNGR